MIDRAIKAVYGTGLGQFDQKASSVGEDKPKVSDLMVPHHTLWSGLEPSGVH